MSGEGRIKRRCRGRENSSATPDAQPSCKTSQPDEILTGLGVAEDRIYLDKGLTGTNRARPVLD
jgi:hypothetical protein